MIVVVAAQKEIPLALLRRDPNQQKWPRGFSEYILDHPTRSRRDNSPMEHRKGRRSIQSPRWRDPLWTMGKSQLSRKDDQRTHHQVASLRLELRRPHRRSIPWSTTSLGIRHPRLYPRACVSRDSSECNAQAGSSAFRQRSQEAQVYGIDL